MSHASSSPNSRNGAASAAPAGEGLETLASRSERLLKDLSTSRDDVLAPVDLNRMLRQVLQNQVALLRALSGGVAPLEAPVVEATPAASEAEAEEAKAEEAAAEACKALAFLGVSEVIASWRAEALVAGFDHRDQDLDRGLDKLNRWTEGSGGTPFQVRADVAYLNLGSSAESAQRYQENLTQRMGFSRLLGRLTHAGLQGDIVVYERP